MGHYWKTIGENQVAVTEYCYKVVIDAKTHKKIYCLFFPNNENNSVTSVSSDELKVKLGYAVAEEE